jgi:hypothetical protein
LGNGEMLIHGFLILAQRKPSATRTNSSIHPAHRRI